MVEKTKEDHMKTWEMIRELTENPEKEFRVVGAKHLISKLNKDINAIKVLNASQTGITINPELHWEWEEIKQPVTFMEAFGALRHRNKDIRCELNNATHYFTEDYQGNHSFSEELISLGKWYIED